jgi:hypothetical protein
MGKKTETFTLADVRPRLVRTAHVPALVRVTDDPDDVDEETLLGTDDVTAAKFGGAPFLSKEAPAAGMSERAGSWAPGRGRTLAPGQYMSSRPGL